MVKEFTSYLTAHRSAEHVANMKPIDNWKRSDDFHNSFLIKQDEVLDKVLQNCADNGLPDIAVSIAQGKFFSLLARSIGAKKIIEVGTLGG
jgi:predicted O-methyltransferase YrrM